MLKYEGVLIAVADITVSRRFYEELLGQKVGLDFGVNVGFEGGLAIHQKDHFRELLGGEPFAPVMRSHTGELYFETNELEIFEKRLVEAGCEFIHPVREQPWAQRVMRLYDPDGHVLEIAETMDVVVLRLAGQGKSVDEICQKTGMPRAYVENVLGAARAE